MQAWHHHQSWANSCVPACMCMVLTEWRNGGYEILDPYFPTATQPLWMDGDVFAVHCFAGEVVLAAR